MSAGGRAFAIGGRLIKAIISASSGLGTMPIAVRVLNLCMFFAVALGCRGQNATGQWMRSDAAQLAPAEVHGFLEQICPGHTSASGCAVCPEGTAFAPPASTQTWGLKAIILGHFLTPASEDALVSGMDCEPHADGMSGSFLFTRERSTWHKVRYEAGVNAWDCKKLTGSDGRDRLVCAAGDMHQGFIDEFVYLLDPGRDPATVDPMNDIRRGDLFFDVGDSLRGCVALEDGSVLSGSIAGVTFTPLPEKHGVRIVVSARLGQAVVPKTVREEGCAAGLRRHLRIATVLRRYAFVFDGATITPAPNNPPMNYRSAVAPRTSYSTTK